MKIAVLISGQISTFCYKNTTNHTISTSEFWKSAIKNHDFDFFAVTETNNFYSCDDDCLYFTDYENMMLMKKRETWRSYKNMELVDDKFAMNKIQSILYETFGNSLISNNIYTHTEMTTQILDDIKNNKCDRFYNYKGSCRPDYNKKDIMSQFFKLKKCFELLDNYISINNTSYDAVIRIRFDTQITNLNQLYLSNLSLYNVVYTDYCSIRHHANDWFYLGNYNIMKKICNYYDYMCPNLINNEFHLLIKTDEKYMKLIKEKPNKQINYLDVSDSSEVGITYLIQSEKYTIINDVFRSLLWRYYC
jgi:hypothetical protein